MSAILYANRPITFDAPPQTWLSGELIDNGDGTNAIRLSESTVLSVNPDGTYTTSSGVNGTFERCVKGTANTLNYTPYSDRPGVHATYAIPFRDQ